MWWDHYVPFQSLVSADYAALSTRPHPPEFLGSQQTAQEVVQLVLPTLSSSCKPTLKGCYPQVWDGSTEISTHPG